MEEEKKKVSIEEEEKVDILDLLDAAAEFLSNPTDEQTYSRFNQMKANLVIRTFLPIEQKRTVMLKTLYDLNVNDMGGENVAVALEISLTFNGLFAYVVHVDYDISDVLKDEAFYDVFWVSGLGDYILGFCEKDFNRLKNMVTSMVSF